MFFKRVGKTSIHILQVTYRNCKVNTHVHTYAIYHCQVLAIQPLDDSLLHLPIRKLQKQAIFQVHQNKAKGSQLDFKVPFGIPN